MLQDHGPQDDDNWIIADMIARPLSITLSIRDVCGAHLPLPHHLRTLRDPDPLAPYTNGRWSQLRRLQSAFRRQVDVRFKTHWLEQGQPRSDHLLVCAVL